MATDPKDRPHGDLNPWSRKKRNTVSDTDLLRKQKDDHVNPDILTELPGPLLGIALENGVRVPVPYSITEPSRTKENRDVLIVRAKIIEQDCSPHPSDIINFHCADHAISESELFSIHDIFVAVNSEINDAPAPGDLVFVDYENRRTRSGPKYFGLKERSTGGTTPGRVAAIINSFKTPASTPSLTTTTAPPNNGSPLPTPITPITSPFTPSVLISQPGCKDDFNIILGAPIPIEIQPLMQLIASGEGRYNSMNQGIAINPTTNKKEIIGSTHNSADILGRKLTDMTFKEILEYQSQKDPKTKLSAAGKYQITPNTMKWIVNIMKIPLAAKFDEANQESMGLGLIKYKRPEVWQYLLGQNNNETQALIYLSREWASLPDPQTGLSYYDLPNKARHTIQKVQNSLNSARDRIIANCTK